MYNKDFSTTFLLDQTPTEVFDGICNVSSWWTGDPGVEGNTIKTGDEFTYRHKKIHYSKQRITGLIPGSKIAWLVIESELSFIKNKNEWTGTNIIFEISPVDGKTELRFAHLGLTEVIECYTNCSKAWNFYINESLREYIEATKVPIT
jgi:hypothetical protein